MEGLDEKKLGKDKLKALELAEDSREQDWTQPSFIAELFQGRVRWDLIVPYPVQSEEDRKIGDEFLTKLEAVLKEHIDPDKVDETGEISDAAIKALADIGCFALKIPKEYGGVELSQVNYARALHLVATYCASTSVLLSAHQSIGVPQPLKVFGTKEQKEKYFPQFAKGAISAFALTEPEVGSDPAKMTTTAEPSEDGSHFIINGEKLWCTNGPKADILVVMAKTPSKIVRGKERSQITAFIVEKTMPGVEVVHRCRFMGLNGIYNGLLKFTNVKVPRENIIAGEGQGLKLALTTLNTGRLSLPACVTGASKWCLKIVRKWANEREQWGGPIGKHEAIASKIATMTATTFAMDAIGQLSSAMVDEGKTDIRLEAAVAKLACTEASLRIVDGTVQIRGGRGYERATSLRARGEKGYAVERLMRDARINTIIEGTSQIMRLFIAREAMDDHVRRIMALLSPRKTPTEKVGLGVKSFFHYALWYPNTFIPKAPYPQGVSVPPKLQSHMKFIERTSRKLARNLFHSMMIYQQGLESKQQLMARLVNVGTDLFSMAGACAKALKMYGDNPRDEGPLELADLFCLQARARVKKQFRGLFINKDKYAYKIAQNTLAGKYDWLENDIVDPEDTA